MKAINIFSLTRNENIKYTRRFEKQMSERRSYLSVKDWEIEGLRKLSNRLCVDQDTLDKLYFFYSFQIPKLGKEFDLLQISQDKVLNIELKSQEVEDYKIRKQLILNKSYLALLGKVVYSFTYISSQDRLVRLTNSGRLKEANWNELEKLLRPKSECVLSGVEELFLEEKYLLSPLSDPDRFLRRDYFLTAQQKDIGNRIIRTIEEKRPDESHYSIQGFTGLPGTGKTLLLYDLAMYFSKKQKVSILHFGEITEEMQRLNGLLKRIDFITENQLADSLTDCVLLCVDEGHRMKETSFEKISAMAKEKNVPMVISYDDESMICPKERQWNTDEFLNKVPGYIKYSLTNRIRTNRALSYFIQNMMHLTGGFRKKELPEVKLLYANHSEEAEWFVKGFQKEGYMYIETAGGAGKYSEDSHGESYEVFSKEYDFVVMTIDQSLYYDSRGYLRQRSETVAETDFKTTMVGNLFHGLSRAKKGVALIVTDNKPVFENIMNILQGQEA